MCTTLDLGRPCTGTLLTAQHRRQGPAAIVWLTGEVDLTSADVMRDALTAALADATPPHPIVVDLTEVRFLGSSGLSELVEAHRRAIDRNTPLRIVATTRTVLRPIEVMGLAITLDIHPDITTALASPQAPTSHQQAR